jgi:hypothetical protein
VDPILSSHKTKGKLLLDRHHLHHTFIHIAMLHFWIFFVLGWALVGAAPHQMDVRSTEDRRDIR